MKVRDLGEFGLIELIAGVVAGGSTSGLVTGLGDDAAAWRTEECVEIGTTDSLIQDVHFTLRTATWQDLGWKALAINISDIAAMGGLPSFALVSLGLPPETDVDSVVEFYGGLLEVASKFDVKIAGGNVSSAPLVIINVSLIGKATGGLLTRSAAAPGDRIGVTGYLGQAAAGLKMLNSNLELNPRTSAFLREAHLRPYPRVAEAQILAKHGVRAAIDLSDGLISDLTHIAKASGVGARVWVDRLPIHPSVKSAFAQESLWLALSGGEDYELLFTAGEEVIDRLKGAIQGSVTVIGEVVAEEPGLVRLLDEHGNAVEYKVSGWEHLR